MSYNSISKNEKAIEMLNKAISEHERASNIIQSENDNESTRRIIDSINSNISDLELAKAKIQQVNTSISEALKRKEEREEEARKAEEAKKVEETKTEEPKSITSTGNAVGGSESTSSLNATNNKNMTMVSW